jgi:ergosteryl-3beta-O-L-aspartate synthase
LPNLLRATGSKSNGRWTSPTPRNGAIEYVSQAAMDAPKAEGNNKLTFGGGATANLTAGHNIGGTNITALDNSYQAIAARLRLNQKNGFQSQVSYI